MKQLILVTSLLLSLSLASTSFAQTEKPQAAVAPIAALGAITETQKQIIFNSLLDKLSVYYDLIPQEQFLQAQEAAYTALEEQKCTEEQCIRKIQEFLQVENLFVLQMIRESQDTQLSLTLVDLDKKTVKSDFCQGCNTQTLNERVAALVDKIQEGQTPLPPPASAEATTLSTVGKVSVTSTPSGAEIILDGQLLDQKTKALLENIPLGKHTLLLRKDNLSKIREFTVIPDKTLELKVKLELSKASLFVTSQPFKAELLFDGQRLGQTPFEIETTIGKHQLELRLEGFIPVSREVEVKFGETNKLDVSLADGRSLQGFLSLTSNVDDTSATLQGGIYVPTKLEVKLPLLKKALPIGTYQITIEKKDYAPVNREVTLDTGQEISVDIPLKENPITLEVLISKTENISADDGVFQLFVNGKAVTPASAATQDSEAAYLMKLPEGQYQLEARHISGKYERLTKTVKLFKAQKYTEILELQPNAVYLEHQAWKWQWGSAFVGTLIPLGLWYSENTAVKNANSKKQALLEQMYRSKTQNESHAYHTQAAKQIEVAREHQQNAQIFALLSGGMVGLTWWLWAAEPPTPQPESTLNWQPGLQGEPQIVFSQRW